MTNPTEIAGHVMTWATVLKEVAGLAKSAKDLAQDSGTNKEVITLTNDIIELQSKVSDLHCQHMELAAVKAALEEKVAKHDTWKEEKRNYRLKEIADGLSVYVFQRKADDLEAPHWLCTNCFCREQKSIFVLITEPGMTDKVFQCPSCRLSIKPRCTPGKERIKQE
jgi:hypothetical protein